ncbi:MAG: HAD family hydrolase [Alphaproteobacteria bacterium]|nr:HAD family hydrolase [Alphaproteobacteria bacterium]
MRPDQLVVVFDWNGTLINDTWLTWRAVNEILVTLGGRAISEEQYKAAYRMPLKAMYQELGLSRRIIEEQEEIVFKIFGDVYQSLVHKTTLHEGTRETLHYLKKQEHKSLILSNHNRPCIERQLKRFGLETYFDEVLANAPDEYKNIMHKAGKKDRLDDWLKRHKCYGGIVVGDSPEEMDIALQHGFTSVAVESGCCLRETLERAKPDWLVKDLKPLPSIIQHVYGERHAP